MMTPDTVSANDCIKTPFHDSIQAVSRQTTASTLRLSFGGSLVNWTSDDNNINDDGRLPTFEVCSRAIMDAADRMMALTRQPHSLTMAIAYDECLDIVTAALNHLELIGSRGVLADNVLDVYQAMRSIHELLRPSPPVRRALKF